MLLDMMILVDITERRAWTFFVAGLGRSCHIVLTGLLGLGVAVVPGVRLSSGVSFQRICLPDGDVS